MELTTVPDISVIICTRNRAPVLGSVLEHMRGLVADVSWELIVVDNGSTDSTREVVKASPLHARYIYEPVSGHSIALNAGVRAARARVVAFTDDDAYVGTTWLSSIATIVCGSTADWVFGPVHPRWPRAVPDWYGSETRALVAALDYGPRAFRAVETRHHFAGVNHAGRKDLLDQLGGYREDLGAKDNAILGIGNDEDLFRRLVASGASVLYEPAMQVQHCVSEARCERAFHRRGIQIAATGFASYLHRQRPYGKPVPRWMWRKPIDHALAWVRATSTGNRSAAFYHEIQIRRFLRILRYSRTAPVLK